MLNSLEKYLKYIQKLRMGYSPICLVLTENNFRNGITELEHLKITRTDVALCDKVIVLDKKLNVVVCVLKERNPRADAYVTVNRPENLKYDVE